MLLMAAGVASAGPKDVAPPGPGDDCVACHDQWKDARTAHAPTWAGLCAACHRSTSPRQHFFEFPAEGTDLCLQCHVARSHLTSLHAPSAQGLCAICHQPHASAQPALLRQPPTELCLTCHPTKRTEPLATSPGQCGATTQGCDTCHDAHQSKGASMLKAETERATCLRCHDTPVVTHSKETLVNLGAQLALASSTTQLHGPIQQGRCGDCHQPHGTDAWRRLRSPMPKDSYAPFVGPETYELCFRCHDNRLVTQAVLVEPGTPGAAFSSDGGIERWPGVTAFRNGSDNLHFKHVSLNEKGRGCRFCHDVHSASGRGLVKSTARLGDWEFRLGFQPRPSGGSCWPGCHAQRAYDVVTKQENLR
jgi:predicted CXXCH cytochrome family protein